MKLKMSNLDLSQLSPTFLFIHAHMLLFKTFVRLHSTGICFDVMIVYVIFYDVNDVFFLRFKWINIVLLE